MDARIYSEKSISSIKEHLERGGSKFVTFPKFIFLCGKGIDPLIKDSYEKSNRGIIDAYIRKLLPEAKIVLSEKLWEDGFDDCIDLLTFEEFLAEVSDAIILFVESPGAFCELGAFVYANALFSDKLIIVMDEKRRNSRSFIATGPVLKARKNGSKIVYASTEDGSLLASSELRKQIIELVDMLKSKRAQINKRIINECGNTVYISSFIVELLELLKLTQPISKNDLLQLYKRVKGFDAFTLVKRDGTEFSREIKFGYILKLLSTAGIISETDSVVRLVDCNKPQSFMLRYQGRAMDKERSRIICRKYRYGGTI